MAKNEIEPIHKTKDERQYWLVRGIIPDSAQYPAHLKFATIMKYATCGSLRETERATGVPRATIRGWMNADWWAEAYRRAEEFQSSRISAKMTRLINSSVDKLQNKIDEGELVIIRDKYGVEIAREHQQLPAKTLLDITKAAASHSSLSREIRKQEATAVSPNINNRLLSLAEDCVKVQQAMAGIHAKPVEGETVRVTEHAEDVDTDETET